MNETARLCLEMARCGFHREGRRCFLYGRSRHVTSLKKRKRRGDAGSGNAAERFVEKH